jgi:hypothetical protein
MAGSALRRPDDGLDPQPVLAGPDPVTVPSRYGLGSASCLGPSGLRRVAAVVGVAEDAWCAELAANDLAADDLAGLGAVAGRAVPSRPGLSPDGHQCR